MPREFTYEIEEEIATLSSYEGARGRIYSKELSLISYNGANAVYDIRNWTDYHDEEAHERLILNLIKIIGQEQLITKTHGKLIQKSRCSSGR